MWACRRSLSGCYLYPRCWDPGFQCRKQKNAYLYGERQPEGFGRCERPCAARLQLLARIAQDLAATDAIDEPEATLLELEGLGAEIWQGIVAQQYVNELRDEWDKPR